MKPNSTIVLSEPLRQEEIELIYLIRTKYRFGMIEVVLRDGIPVDVLRTVQRTRLGGLSTSEVDAL